MAPLAPSPDLPALTVRWEGLVVAIDATTLNTFARQAVRNVPEVREVTIDPEDGRLGITVRVKKGIVVAFRGELRDLRVKDGYLGFAIADLRVFKHVPIPNWIIRKIVDRQPPGRAFFYAEVRLRADPVPARQAPRRRGPRSVRRRVGPVTRSRSGRARRAP